MNAPFQPVNSDKSFQSPVWDMLEALHGTGVFKVDSLHLRLRALSRLSPPQWSTKTNLLE